LAKAEIKLATVYRPVSCVSVDLEIHDKIVKTTARRTLRPRIHRLKCIVQVMQPAHVAEFASESRTLSVMTADIA
jgi:hypothetical protein